MKNASSVWDHSAQFEINRLEKVQPRKKRFVIHQYRRKQESELTSAEIVKNLKWDTLQNRRTVARLTMLYKRQLAVRWPQPTHHMKKADARRRSCANNFRHYIGTNKSAFYNTFYVRTIRDWNKLPQDVKSAPSAAAFKARLQRSP